MMLHTRDQRLAELLQAIARGGLSDQQLARTERDIEELKASAAREEEWQRLTRADYQPRFRSVDSF
jgi:anti-sigma factor RsiW